MSLTTSQNFESYLTVSDTLPSTFEEAMPIISEQLKKIAQAVNVREIGWYLDEELLSGGQFIPGVGVAQTEQQFRTILRKVVNTGALIAGVNTINHGITFDANFTLIDMWASGTNSSTFTARTITGNDVTLNATQITITSPQIFNRSFCVFEYLQEL